jgi:tripartite-type tricarboxylate transporter receptor subunit TctC
MRRLLVALAFFASFGNAGAPARDYPARPVQLVVGYPAGVTPDIIARLLAQSLSDQIGQRVIVDNRPGAGSNIATEAVVRAPADGYTLLVLTFANAVNATLYKRLNFDIERDIVPIVGTFRSPTVMVVTPSFPGKTVPELIAYAKANPGKVNYASAGYGTVNNVASELFNTLTGAELVHVPYRGTYLPDLLGGQVQVTFTPIATTLEYIKAGKLRALAVTSAERLEILPDVPAMEASVWHGIGAPVGTPAKIVSELNREINAALADPRIKARFAELGGTVLGGSSPEFGRLVADEIKKWGKVIGTANIRSE